MPHLHTFYFDCFLPSHAEKNVTNIIEVSGSVEIEGFPARTLDDMDWDLGEMMLTHDLNCSYDLLKTIILRKYESDIEDELADAFDLEYESNSTYIGSPNRY